uniref:Uncharacterized protein n=1 Tax=Oryza barthii TaxID=65489 RepID=A0A0D3GTK4_9ORYZ
MMAWSPRFSNYQGQVSTVPFHGLARYVFAAKGVGLYKDQIIRVHRIRLLSLSFLVHVVTRHQGPQQKQSARIVIFTQRRLCTATTTSMARSAADSNHPIKEHALADENGS